jgi:hypothetical protein
MHIVVGAILLVGVIALSVLLIIGFPVGELTMGGKNKVWPKEMRPIAIAQLVTQVFALYVLLAAGKIGPVFINNGFHRFLCILFALIFTGNLIMNAYSTSKKEKYIMTPLSSIEAICFALAAVGV